MRCEFFSSCFSHCQGIIDRVLIFLQSSNAWTEQVVKSACKAIVCDLVVLLEGQAEDELPERVRICDRKIALSPVIFILGALIA